MIFEGRLGGIRFELRPPQRAALLGARAEMLLARPGEGLASTSPVSRRRLSQRPTVANDTPKTRTISSRGMLRSTAASTLILRSFEYAFMVAASHVTHPFCKLL